MHEAVIIDVIRTPIGKRNGSLKAMHPVDLLAFTLKTLIKRTQIDPSLVDDVISGCVTQTGEQGVNIGRNAWLSAGLPETVPATTIDRQCGSSLQAAHFAAQGVMAGAYDMVIACGVESMTRVPMGSNITQGPGVPMTQDLARRYPIDQGWFDQAFAAEKVARQWALTRQDLDEFSLQSHERAHQAQIHGDFESEVIAVPTSSESREAAMFAHDEGIRTDTSLAKLASLRPAFEGLELVSAGNASQISDGASAALITSRETAERLGLKPRARFISFAVVGVDPVLMLTGPIPATRKALKAAGMPLEAIDLFEVNEAFASVVLAWQKELGVPANKVNLQGGAVALGHPLGATGTRILATMVNALERRRQRYGLIAICEGAGMANATIVERL